MRKAPATGASRRFHVPPLSRQQQHSTNVRGGTRMIEAIRELVASYTAIVLVGVASFLVYAPFLGIYLGVKMLRRRRRGLPAFERRYRGL